MMHIRINGEERNLPSPITLQDLLREMGVGPSIAVVINREVIPRSEFETVALRDQDQVEIIHPVGGG